LKALVVYGTRWGGTVGVAEKIGESIVKSGHSADVLDARSKLRDIASYDLVIVGSGIRADQWTKSTLAFLDRNVTALKSKKTALFVSCQMADREANAQLGAKKKYLFEIAEKYGLEPIAFGFFGGYIDFKKSHGIVVDIMVRINRRKLLSKGLDIHKVHDTRNWGSIENWASQLARLASGASKTPSDC
jgi:menaquinone-dependent protoporphyrinogen oxidase